MIVIGARIYRPWNGAGGNDVIQILATKRHLVVLLLVTMGVMTAGQVAAEEDMFDGKWHFSLTPYLFVPKISGTVTYQNPAGGGGSMSATVDPNSYLESLDFAAMFAAEARKGDALIFTDYMYLHLGGQDAVVKSVTGPGGDVHVPVNEGGSFKVVANVWTLAAGFSVLHKPQGFLDLFGGVRLLNLSSSVGWNFSGPISSLAKEGSVSQTNSVWDAIVGLKGQVRFGQSNWFLPYYADIGGATNSWTWQAALGVGYHFGWGDIVLLERNLSYNSNGQLAQPDVRMTGPMLGATFKF
jgi:hypothetical protein